MGLFNRNKTQDQDETTEESAQESAAADSERTGVAWLLAVATLAVTVVLALGLFFGGRLAYRTVFDNDTADEQVAEENISGDNVEELPSAEEEAGQENVASNEQADSPGVVSEDVTDPSDESEQAGQSEQPSSTPQSGGSEVAGESTSELPETGPGDTLAVFLATVLIASTLHYTVATVRSRS